MDGTLKRLLDLLDVAQELDTNLTRSSLLTTIPGVAAMGGVFFFSLGLVGSIMFFNIAMASSILNAFTPLIKHERKLSNQIEMDKSLNTIEGEGYSHPIEG